MKLVPTQPPGRGSRRARGFAPEIRELRAHGYTFEAIREALAAVGVRVSNSTVQREAARYDSCVASNSAAVNPDRGDQTPSEALTPTTPIPPAVKRYTPLAADPRSGKEIADEYMSKWIANPLIRSKEQT
ncbi:MAG: hypothetical protein KGL18_05280 [Burkholderiales bacterium]|nr:hypothetical protein [Burkholderiales bacterium]MDE1927919.1 hypothetical protein [Burkholderiales bacterium]MDE2157311.1 hypothetical protein [Burkholderiales bacterium]MDE2502372.1 hypothetical protein [Burkholderiales bacterium]